ncbi:hypothetical protein ABZ912_37540 [Nonomuraea angiospora]|uniref:hypothetical protein n=1 Tax=Nonomuraea angiospora TaxID=46172 RepID=UPI0033C6D4FF
MDAGVPAAEAEAVRVGGDPEEQAKVRCRRPVGPATMPRIRATLRHALNIAIKQDRLIDFNPAAVVELPRVDCLLEGLVQEGADSRGRYHSADRIDGESYGDLATKGLAGGPSGMSVGQGGLKHV